MFLEMTDLAALKTHGDDLAGRGSCEPDGERNESGEVHADDGWGVEVALVRGG